MSIVRHIFFVGTALTFASASAASESWHVSERSGAVTVLHSGVIKAALGGAEVVAGDLVTTGPNGRAVLVRGEDYLVVAPSSKLHVAQPVATNPLLQVFQDSGNVVYKIKHLVTPHFSVQTPYLAAVVKGTTFSITVTEAGTALQVIQGALEVQTNDGGAKELVTTGMVALVKSSDMFRLSVGGATPHAVVSPNTRLKSAEPFAKPVTTGTSAPVIATRITEPAVSIATLTAGLVDGSAAFASDATNTTKTTALIKTAMADATAALAAAKVAPSAPTPTPTPTVTVAPPDTVVAAAPVPVQVPVQTSPPAVSAATTPAVVSGCAGVPNCNGSTYTGPSNVANGSSCAGVANCNGGAFNTTTVAALPPVAVTPAPVVAPPPVAVAVVTPTPAPVVASIATPKPAVTPPAVILPPATTALKTNNSNGNGNSANAPGQGAFAAALAALLAKAATFVAALPTAH